MRLQGPHLLLSSLLSISPCTSVPKTNTLSSNTSEFAFRFWPFILRLSARGELRLASSNFTIDLPHMREAFTLGPR